MALKCVAGAQLARMRMHSGSTCDPSSVASSYSAQVNTCSSYGGKIYKIRKLVQGLSATSLKTVYSFAVFSTLADCQAETNIETETVAAVAGACKLFGSSLVSIVPLA